MRAVCSDAAASRRRRKRLDFGRNLSTPASSARDRRPASRRAAPSPTTDRCPRAVEASLGRALLGLPLFLKVLVANCVVVLVGVGLGHVVHPDLRCQSHGRRGALGRRGGDARRRLCGSVLINAIVLRLALQPLHALERTVDRVAAGDLSARAQPRAVPRSRRRTTRRHAEHHAGRAAASIAGCSRRCPSRSWRPRRTSASASPASCTTRPPRR